MSGTTLQTGLAMMLAMALLTAAPRVGHAQGEAPASGASGAAPDTGFVEVGGKDAFGADDPFADLPSSEDEGSFRPEGGRLFPYLTYNRVDAFTFGLDQSFRPSRGWKPGFVTRVARAFGRENGPGMHDGRWLYTLRLEQPIAPGRHARVGISTYRRTDDDEFGQVGDVENALAALFFHDDYKDWFEREGYGLDADWTWHERWMLSTRYEQDAYTSIPLLAEGTRGVFRRNASWRENPAVDDGDLRAVTFGIDYDSRSNKKSPRRGMIHRLRAETAGGDLGGGFAYKRYSADLRAYFSPGPSHLAKARVLLGTTSKGDDLPFQKTFAIGGIGTLRGATFRQFRGRHMFLANGDWSWELFKRSSRNHMLKTGLAVVAFTDFGLAWDAPTWDLGHRKPAWDAGLGLGTTDESFRVYFARDLRAERSPLHVTVRIARSY
ncbi:MAG: BamA/TamA family outer membrane protein [Candidatus Eisenbacteria bacterium]